MAATATATDQLRKGAKVMAAAELRGVPEGTAGRVIVVDGLTWIRYWVRFDNGVSLGSVPRHKLVTPDQLKRRGDGGEGAEVAATGPDDAAPAAGSDGDGGTGGRATPAGTLVPQKLLDRSAAARARVGS